MWDVVPQVLRTLDMGLEWCQGHWGQGLGAHGGPSWGTVGLCPEDSAWWDNMS